MRTQTRERLRFTDEQLQNANNVSIIDLARRYGLMLEDTERKAFHVKDSGGLYLYKNGNKYYHFGSGKAGGAVDFVIMMENISFVDAVKSLLGSDYAPVTAQVSSTKHDSTKYESSKEKGELILPPKGENFKQAYWYLCSVRGIETDIVSKLMNERKIYQDSYRNCVFVGFDSENKPQYCSKRGTYAKAGEKPYKGDHENSDKSFPFHMAGKSTKVYVCESPIDCMSHASLAKLHGVDWTADHRISLGCLSDKALERFLKIHDITAICFALDNDINGKSLDGSPCNHGQEAARKYAEKYKEMGYKVSIHTPKSKDFNEDLLDFRQAVRELNVPCEQGEDIAL